MFSSFNFSQLWVGILCSATLVGLGWASSIFMNKTAWYKALKMPAFKPPSWLFAPVWGILYTFIGLSFYGICTYDYNCQEAEAITKCQVSAPSNSNITSPSKSSSNMSNSSSNSAMPAQKLLSQAGFLEVLTMVGQAIGKLFSLSLTSVLLWMFIVQVILNFAWTPVFFRLKNLRAALLIIVSMWLVLLIMDLMFAWYGISIFSVIPLVWIWTPYLLWVTFATGINLSIYLLNPEKN